MKIDPWTESWGTLTRQDEEDEEEPDREHIFQGGNAVLNAVKHRKLG